MKQNVFTPLIQHSDEVFSSETPHTNVFLGGTIDVKKIKLAIFILQTI